MVKTALVDSEIEKGKNVLSALDNSGLFFGIASWMYDEDAESWQLVLGMPGIRQTGTREAYFKIYEVLKSLDFPIELSDIRVLDTEQEPLSLIRSVIKTGPDLEEIRFIGNSINGRSIPDSLIYRVH